MQLTKFKWLIFLAGLSSSSFGLGSHKKIQWVSTSPQVTELFFQLGLEDYLCATPSGSHYPEGAKQLKTIGHWLQPNLESILAKRPTGIVWDETSFNPEIENDLQKLNIESLKLKLNSVQNLMEASQTLLRKFNHPKENSLLMKGQKSWKENGAVIRPFQFLALAWVDPPLLFGEKTFFFDLLRSLGGTGILPQSWRGQFLKVSEEWLMAQSPEKVIFLSHNEKTTQLMKEQCLKWWPEKRGLCKALSAEKFARASLTPLLNLEELKTLLERKDG